MRAAVLWLIAAAAWAQESERALAEWILRLGGGVTLAGSQTVIRDLSLLPPGGLRIEVADFTGTLLTPEELKRLRHLQSIRELHLPAPMWNEGAGSRRDSNEAFEYLAGLKTLETLSISVHFLTTVSIQDKGIALLRPLAGLKEIRLGQSRIKGHTFAPFENMRSIDVSYTQFDDEGMRALRSMSKLERLVVKDTLVTDAGLPSVGNMKDLTHLNLYGCRLTDAGVASLKGLKKLRQLNLLGARLTDESMDVIAGLTDLEELNLYRSQITNAGLEKLKALKKLASLDLRYTRVTRAGIDGFRAANPRCRINFLDSAPSRATLAAAAPKAPGAQAMVDWIQSLGGLARIESGQVVDITLAQTPVTDAQLKHLAALKSLRRLDLEATETGDVGLRALAGLTAIEELDVSHTTVTDAGLDALASVGLKRLYANHAGVRGPALARFPGLVALEIAGSSASDATLGAISKLAALERLRVSHADITDAGLALLKGLERLAVLDVSSNDIEDGGLAQLATLTGLRSLNLNYARFTDKGVAALKALPGLERLEVARTRLTDKGVTELAAIPSLRMLNLNYTQTTDAVLNRLGAMPALEELHLDTGVITDKGVPTLATMTRLKHLNLYHTLVTENGQKDLARQLPGCRIVFDRESALPNRRGS